MAYMMKLTTPYKGMPLIWNLSSPIGPRIEAETQNRPDDIELFQILITERRKYIPRGVQIMPAIVNMTVTKTLDTATAFEIYNVCQPEVEIKFAHRISPASQGKYSYGKGIWNIVIINYMLYIANKEAWEKMPSAGGPCSAILQQSLRKTSP